MTASQLTQRPTTAFPRPQIVAELTTVPPRACSAHPPTPAPEHVFYHFADSRISLQNIPKKQVLGAPTLIPGAGKPACWSQEPSCASSYPLKSEPWFLHSNPPHSARGLQIVSLPSQGQLVKELRRESPTPLLPPPPPPPPLQI